MNDVQEIKQMIQKGEKQEAAVILAEILRSDPNNGDAWLLMAATTKNVKKKLDCYHQVLRIHPDNHQIAERIKKITNLFEEEKFRRDDPVSNTGVSDNELWKENILYWIVIGMIFVGVVFIAVYRPDDEDSYFYKPNEHKAYQASRSYVNQELLTSRIGGGGPGCEHRPEWFHIETKYRGGQRYDVRGAVISGNWACLKDVSYYSTTVIFDKIDRVWKIIGKVELSNRCIAYPEISCSSGDWYPGWKP